MIIKLCTLRRDETNRFKEKMLKKLTYLKIVD